MSAFSEKIMSAGVALQVLAAELDKNEEDFIKEIIQEAEMSVTEKICTSHITYSNKVGLERQRLMLLNRVADVLFSLDKL